MRTRNYRSYHVELSSEEMRTGEWVAGATVVVTDGKMEKRIPIFGRRRATFDTRQRADAYAFELAKLWIDGRLWGTNGRG